MNYLFISQDSFPKDKAIDRIKSKLLNSGSFQMNVSIYQAGDDGVREVLACANTFPFGVSQRIVIVRKCGRLVKDDMEILLRYLKRPAAHTTLILDAENNVGGNRLWKEVAKYVRVVNFERLEGKGFEECVEGTLDAFGKTIRKDAVNLFKELVDGGDLRILDNELQKLVLFTEKRTEITRDDVVEIVGKNLEEDIYELGEMISRRKVHRALEIVSDLMMRKTRPHEIIGLLAWYFRKGYRIRSANVSLKKRLKRNIDVLLSTDFTIKRSRVDPRVALEVAIIKLCNGAI